MRVSYAIVFVSDMQRSVAFYRDVIGLPVRFETSHWTEFDSDGATLALHYEKGAASSPQDREAPGSCRPGLAVPDLDAFHERMTSRGVKCLREPEEVFGARLALYLDPDGLPISVGEHRQR